jgi:BirA family transcriptional regulator, biotin operon repressor / biotin---[acetyl-CoA-carboxylase] ligase
MTSMTRHPQRMPLSATSLRPAVLAGSRLYTAVDVVAQTGSTNADLAAAAQAGAAAGTVLVAEEQTAGRGRLDRSWQSQPGSALTFSVLLRPVGVPPACRGWLPLLTGVAVASALRTSTGVDVSLKWPNDVLARSGASKRAESAGQAGDAIVMGKLAGILAEQTGDAIVVGIGLNVSAGHEELPSEQATSLWLEGAAEIGREAILIATLRELEHWYLRWADGPEPGDAAVSGLRAAYLRCCSTVGQYVRVELPGGGTLTGRACDVDSVGRLLVGAPDGMHAMSAGDVVHVRPVP